jgi:ribosomal-protein-alanine N-acetyltransferase
MPQDPFERLLAFPVLETERLTLREVTADDAPWYLAHFSRPEIVQGQGYAPPADLEAARRELHEYFTRLFSRHAGLRWGLELRAGAGESGGAADGGSAEATGPEAGALIGSAGLYDWDEEVRSAEIGYDLDPAYWGRGLMAEALSAIFDFAFTQLDANRLQAIAIPGNSASRSLLERLGFTQEGVLREHGHDEHGGLVDDVMYSLLRREWRTK